MSNKIILERARNFYSKISERYAAEHYYERVPLNVFWREQNMPVMYDIIEGADGPEEVVHRAQQTFMFSVNVASPIKERAVDWLLEEQRSRGVDIFSLPPEIQESAYSYADNNVDRQGRRLTPDFIRTVNIGHKIGRYFKPGRRGFDILELGGGLGHLARTMKLLGHTRSHVILDLPETLVFSYCFLSLNFPGARTVLVENEDSARAITAGGYDFAFVPALFAEAITTRPYDLFVNTASLGEMPNRTIRYWMNFIQNSLTIHFIYTLNRYLNTIDPSRHAWRWEENECSVHYDRRWDFRQWELEPRFTRCPYVDTLIARYLEIAAARLKTIDAPACAQRAAELLRMVQEQDWYNVKDNSAIMMRGDHILAHDLGMDGTLFKLWNSLRLHPSADGVATLLRYLDTLLSRKDRVFEEQQFYQDLFLALFDAERDSTLQEFASQLRKRVQLQTQSPSPTLIESRDNYNFVSAGDKVIAISTALGSVHLFQDRLGEQELSPILFTGENLETVREKVRAFEKKTAVPDVELIDESGRYNVVRAGERFIAVAKELGPSNLFREQLGERELPPVLFTGESLEEVREKSMAWEATTAQPAPELLGDTAGYNLLRVEERFLAVAKSLGPTQLFVERLGKRELSPILLIADTLEEVRGKAITVELQDTRPVVELVGETVKFNLVKLGSRFVAITKSLGQVSPMVERLGERELAPLLFTGMSLEEVCEKARAHEKELSFPEVKLIEETADYNLVKAGDRFIGIAKKLGPINLFQERLGDRELPPIILIAPDVSILRQRISEHTDCPSNDGDENP